jgi:hypothetical protein
MHKVFLSLILLLVAFPMQASTNYDYFAKVLQLEKRWERFSVKTIDQYLVYLGKKDLYEGLSPDMVNKLKREISVELKERLNWEKVGERFVTKVMSGCSSETLNNFADAYESKSIEVGRSAASEYLECASTGINKSLVIIREEIQKATPSLSRIVKKYRE